MAPLIILALGAALACIAGYVQLRLPNHIRNNTRRRVTRLLLLLGGASLGLVCAYWPDSTGPTAQVGLFLGGFGAAHVPLFWMIRHRRQR